MKLSELKPFLDLLSTAQLVQLRKKCDQAIKRKQPRKCKQQFDQELLKALGLVKQSELRQSPKTAFRAIMADDWTNLFTGPDDDTDHFVYFHVDPRHTRKDQIRFNLQEFFGVSYQLPIPFYVGMGKGDRAYNFHRQKFHTELLSALLSEGFTRDAIVYVIEKDMSWQAARELESKFILYFGCTSFRVKTNGKRLSKMGRCLINAQYEPMPEHWKTYR